METNSKIFVVIPVYKVSLFIIELISSIGPEVAAILVVDDACPEGSGKLVEKKLGHDRRIKIIFHDRNQGVGAAMISGYQYALEQGADIVVKLDGDGQMNPCLIEDLVAPIISGRADYVKGNRFFMIESLRGMPLLRVVGNSGISFLSKFAHGYWNVMDPTNGFIAIHAAVLQKIPLEKLDRGYFFENDMLFHLATLRAVVCDFPMVSKYGEEKSSLNVLQTLIDFPPKFFVRVIKRFGYNYFLRDFNACSIELVVGLIMVCFGFGFGSFMWIKNYSLGIVSSAGTVMLAGLPVLVGLNLLIAALSYDIANVPTVVLHKLLHKKS
jgi:glycosyltransferase involved in cell wall biosynthesis